MAVVTVIHANTAIEVLACYRVIGQFREVHCVAIKEIAAFETVAIAVITILQFPSSSNEIAIFSERKIMGVFAILTTYAIVIHHRNLRHRLHECVELREEWLVEVDLSSVDQRIEFVTPPTCEAVHWIR